MNKRIIILILFTLIILICIVSTIQLNTTPNDISNFKELIKKENFLIKDTTNDYNDPIVKESYIAYNNEYQIEVIVFNNDTDSENAFKANITSLTLNDNVEENIKKYKKYTLYTYINNTKYVYIRKQKNTLLYIDTNIEYKESINAIIDKLI